MHPVHRVSSLVALNRGQTDTLRLGTGLAVCVTIAAGLLLQQANAPVAQRIANQLAGDRWFQISLANDPIGYYHTGASQDPHGLWTFGTTTRFALQADNTVDVTERLLFDSAPPYDLVHAHHTTRRRGQPAEQVVIIRNQDQMIAQYDRGRGPGRGIALDWEYTLADYLGFEIWLNETDRQPGESRSVASIDFNRMQIVPKVFALLGKNPDGYVVESASLLDATVIQLDASLAPISLTTSGLFRFERTTQQEALLTRTRLNQVSYRIPVEGTIPDHTSVASLRLQIDGPPEIRHIWPMAEAHKDGYSLDLSATSPTADTGPVSLLETATYPIHHPEVLQLKEAFADVIADAATSDEIVSALVNFVHNQLIYTPGQRKLSVLQALAAGQGECTEFADLFTTLARAAGYPARTVIGLAYAAEGEPAFAYHAWNEVEIDGDRHAVDPTWNLNRIDATHIALPEAGSTLMRLLNAAPNIRFKVEQIRYFDPLAGIRRDVFAPDLPG
jgi:hypothetical protein